MSAALADVADLTPAEAVEVLHTRDLWPWSPGDDGAPRWWCERCRGSGLDPRVGLYRKPCAERCDWGTANDPPTLAALAAVASLGVSALRTAEELARVLVGSAPRIAWRVMTREALREHHRRTEVRTGRDVVRVFASEWLCSSDLPGGYSSLGWPAVCPSYYQSPASEIAWPVLRDLAALGLHLVALDGDRVTLAVEAT